jgi:hypothetical protein
MKAIKQARSFNRHISPTKLSYFIAGLQIHITKKSINHIRFVQLKSAMRRDSLQEICGHHGDGYEDYRPLGCDVVHIGG